MKQLLGLLTLVVFLSFLLLLTMHHYNQIPFTLLMVCGVTHRETHSQLTRHGPCEAVRRNMHL
jgi:hypothetical protein